MAAYRIEPASHRSVPGAVAVALLAALALASPAAAGVPEGFDDALVSRVDAVALAPAPGGRLLIGGRLGQVRVYRDGRLLPTVALDISSELCTEREGGLHGLAVDPSFERNGRIYVHYTFDKHPPCEDNARDPVERLSRFTLGADNRVDPDSELVLVDNIRNTGGIHSGGGLAFGRDGYLYAGFGDGGCDYTRSRGCFLDNHAARDLSALAGKLVRITPEGGVPPDNPFLGPNSVRCNRTGYAKPGSTCREIHAYGLRNPWRVTQDPDASSTRMFVNDTGNNVWEEVNLVAAGADYGWNVREGPCAANSGTDCERSLPGAVDPIHSYLHADGCEAITGGAFVPDDTWPAAYEDVYLFGDYVCRKIVALSPDASGYAARDFATGVGNVIDLAFAPYRAGRALYYTTLTGTGTEVRRIAPVAGGSAVAATEDRPDRVAAGAIAAGAIAAVLAILAFGGVPYHRRRAGFGRRPPRRRMP